MARFTDRLKAMFGRGPGEIASGQDSLGYEQVVQLDAEDLAEQGILSVYENLLPTLKQYVALPLDVSEAIDNDAARYSVYAAGKTYEIWEDGAKNSDGWERATVAFFEVVNARDSLNKSTNHAAAR